MSFTKVRLKNSKQAESIEPVFQMYLPYMESVVNEWNKLDVGRLSTFEFIRLIAGSTTQATTEEILVYADEFALKRFLQKAKPDGKSPMLGGYAVSDSKLLEIVGRPNTGSLKEKLANFHRKAAVQINSIKDFLILDNDILSINASALALYKEKTAIYIENEQQQVFYTACQRLKEAVENYTRNSLFSSSTQPETFLPFFEQISHLSATELFEKKIG